MSITLRIGTKVGAWKLTGLSLSSSIASVQSEIEAKHEIPVALQVLTLAGRRGGGFAVRRFSSPRGRAGPACARTDRSHRRGSCTP